MAIAWPGTATTTGVGNASRRSASSNPARTISIASDVPARSTRRSKPAEKMPSRPVRTTT